METLTSTLLALDGSVDHPAPNPFDVYRTHVSHIVSAMTGASPSLVFPALQAVRSLSAGDLVLATGQLQLAEADPAQLIRDKVFPESVLVNRPVADDGDVLQFFFKPAPLAALVLPQALSDHSCHRTGLNPSSSMNHRDLSVLQASTARLDSLLATAQYRIDELLAADFALLTEKPAVDLVRILAHWPVMLRGAASPPESRDVLDYLSELAQALESSYSHLDITNCKPAVRVARLALYVSAQRFLQSGLQLVQPQP